MRAQKDSLATTPLRSGGHRPDRTPYDRIAAWVQDVREMRPGFNYPGVWANSNGKRGQAPFAGTALRVLRTKGDCHLFPFGT